MVSVIRVEIDGVAATAERLVGPVVSNYGHFTSLQVRSGGVRGLGLHLSRLADASRELFGVELDRDAVRRHLRHALGEPLADASVRINVFEAADGPDLSIMVTVSPPADAPAEPVRLHAVPYQRPVAHVKHAGTFGQAYYGRVARAAGFDDALLTTDDGVVSETTIANVAFLQGGTVVWPRAAVLLGTGQQLLQERLTGRPAEVHLADLASFDGAFVVNSRGVAPVARVDDVVFAGDEALMSHVLQVYEAIPAEPV